VAVLAAPAVSFEHVRLSKHARARLRERRISLEQIKRTLNHPHRLERQGERFVAERDTTRGNVLRVVYTLEQDGAALIVTAIRISP
jgi:hypothetical protein